MPNKFKGTGVALVTPFDKDLNIDFNGLEKLVLHTLNEGIDYLVVQGTTGESATINKEEKRAILRTVNNLKNDLPIVVGFGGNSTLDVIEQIKSFETEEYDAVLSVCPYYNKPTQNGLINHFQMIADQSEKPVILYNVPARTSINLTAQSTLILSQHPNIIGVKEASGDFNQCVDIAKNKAPGFLLISGDDLLTLPLISIGAKGVISVIANALTRQMVQIVNSGLKNNISESRRELHNISDVNTLMYKEGNPAGIKCLLEIMGICKSDVRPPLMKASAPLFEEIKAAYTSIK